MPTLALLLWESASIAAPPPAAAPPGAAPIEAEPRGHCAPAETVAFSCDTKGGKTLSVCAGAGSALQYRFGKVGAPELVYPATPDARGFTLAHVGYVRSEGHVLQFTNGGATYAVTSLSGGGCCSAEEAASNNFQGVYVTLPGGKQVTVGCTGAPVDHLDALLETHTVPAPSE